MRTGERTPEQWARAWNAEAAPYVDLSEPLLRSLGQYIAIAIEEAVAVEREACARAVESCAGALRLRDERDGE